MEPKKPVPAEQELEYLRASLVKDRTEFTFVEYGAGSSMQTSKTRSISQIAKSSLSAISQCRQLSRMVSCYKPKNVLEMGTSLGVSTLYIAKARSDVKIFTLEGEPTVANVAQQGFHRLDASNIALEVGRFEKTLPLVLDKVGTVDMAFIDGNHRYEPTLEYFDSILPYCTDQSILVFDDIHWSSEMKEAWKEISSHEKVTMSIDLFHMGVVFLDSSIKSKIRVKYVEFRKKPWLIGLFG